MTNGTTIVFISACTMIIGFAGNGDARASRPHENDTIVSVEDDVAVNTRIVGIEVGELIMFIHFAEMITGITGDGDRIGHDKDRGASTIAVAVVINGPPTASTKHGNG